MLDKRGSATATDRRDKVDVGQTKVYREKVVGVCGKNWQFAWVVFSKMNRKVVLGYLNVK